VDGWLGEFLKIRLTAEPQKGKANEALVALMSDVLRVPRKNISISSGASSSKKVLNISGLSKFEISSRLPGRDG
jgi:uncharacterized protein YggU (UPF0235/DUF167 family)